MEAVYTHLNIERGVPEVFNSTYDIRTLLAAVGFLRDGQKPDRQHPPRVARTSPSVFVNIPGSSLACSILGLVIFLGPDHVGFPAAAA
jgi:hypothetical protein